uniref:Ribose-phosphate pyrophosphokinase N-terminal domain-containing protein n=1 Tax=Parascaris univalens TaxID=6257 RepID=A0A915A4I4_PARUN
MVVLAGNRYPEFAQLVSERLGIRLGDAVIFNKPNRETTVEIKNSVRGKHVFLLQSTSKDVNNSIMELLILIYACKTSYARSITVILPYLPYSKQCRVRRRSAIPMKLVADMICRAGATRLVSLDLYRKEIQGFFSIPVDNLRASPFLLTYIRNRIPDYRNAVIVAKSPDVMHKATSYADRLRLSVAVIHGEAKQGDCQVEEDGRQSPPLENYPADGEQQESSTSTLEKYKLFPRQTVKEKTSLTVIGDMDGRIAIIVDDIIDEAQSFVDAAEVCCFSVGCSCLRCLRKCVGCSSPLKFPSALFDLSPHMFSLSAYCQKMKEEHFPLGTVEHS